MIARLLAFNFLFAATLAHGSVAWADEAPVLTIWRLLDYVAIDYRGAVRGGVVISETEYAEMVEFVGSMKDRLDTLPSSSTKGGLQKQAVELQAAIGGKAAPELIAKMARALATDLIKAYPVPLAPTSVPDYVRGRTLYVENCASCHGPTGDGKGVASVGLKPPPIVFTDQARANERSIFALYQVIEQCLDGTSMASFAHLPSQDRWALAFYVGSLAYSAEDAAKGERLWKADTDLRRRTNLTSLVGERPATFAASLGKDQADKITAYLRRNPGVVVQQKSEPLTLARTRLGEAALAYEKGDRRAATDLALSAYLDGVEPIEPLLAVHDNALKGRIEGAMAELRAAIKLGGPAKDVRAQVEGLTGLLNDAEAALDPHQASSSSSFFGAFTVLLREALEAMLIVVVMLTLLRKAERCDVEPYVHAGWIAALGAGVLTWVAAAYLISISGADREFTEGFGSLLAAFILLWVGIWMHGKSQAGAWQRYVRDRLGHALSQRSAWGLFGLAFIVVYREAFETILFCAAIWNPANAGAILAGAGTAIICLAVIAWALMRYGRTLPVGKFFAYSSALIAVLCVVLVGKGVSALQEAGWLPTSPLAGFIRIDVLGLYPTVQTIAAQVAIAAALLIGFWSNRRRAFTNPNS